MKHDVVLRVATGAVIVIACGAVAFGVSSVATRVDSAKVTPVPLPHASTPSSSPLPLTDIGREYLPDVVTVEADRTNEEALGTGWLFDTKGDFVTNAHVVAGQLALRVTDHSAHTHVAVVVGLDTQADIAVLRSTDGFPGTPLPVAPAQLRTSGDSVIALASSRATGHGDMTSLTITALDQDVPLATTQPAPGFPPVYDNMLELDGPRIYQGNSGGPVIDETGHVVGIITLANSAGLNAFAIPISRVLPELDHFAAQG